MLCDARLELGLTLGQVGEACGVGESGAMTWESGRALPQAARLWRLVELLQLDAVLVVHACDPRYALPADPDELPASDTNTAGGVQ